MMVRLEFTVFLIIFHLLFEFCHVVRSEWFFDIEVIVESFFDCGPIVGFASGNTEITASARTWAALWRSNLFRLFWFWCDYLDSCVFSILCAKVSEIAVDLSCEGGFRKACADLFCDVLGLSTPFSTLILFLSGSVFRYFTHHQSPRIFELQLWELNWDIMLKIRSVYRRQRTLNRNGMLR